jgi:hypothetical protein
MRTVFAVNRPSRMESSNRSGTVLIDYELDSPIGKPAAFFNLRVGCFEKTPERERHLLSYPRESINGRAALILPTGGLVEIACLDPFPKPFDGRLEKVAKLDPNVAFRRTGKENPLNTIQFLREVSVNSVRICRLRVPRGDLGSFRIELLAGLLADREPFLYPPARSSGPRALC